MNYLSRVQIVETGDYSGEIKPVIHRLATSRQLFDVYRLTYECYLARGHFLTRLDGLWIPHPDLDHSAATTILVAELDGEIVGSVSITVDGPQGLPLDRELGKTCTLIRSLGRPLGQVWRLLLRESCPLKRPILISLMAEATHHLLVHQVQTGLYFVQEDYATLCRELTNAITLMRTKSARGLSNSCSILMRMEAENLKCNLPSRIPQKKAVRQS